MTGPTRSLLGGLIALAGLTVAFVGCVPRDHLDVDSGSLAKISDAKFDDGPRFHNNGFNSEISAKLTDCGVFCDAVGFPSSVQRDFTLPDGQEEAADGKSAQERCDNRPVTGSPSLMRCFLSGYGGAPLGAKIGGVVVFGLVTAIGIFIGISRVVASRRGGAFFLLLGFGAWAFFMWWSSP